MKIFSPGNFKIYNFSIFLCHLQVFLQVHIASLAQALWYVCFFYIGQNFEHIDLSWSTPGNKIILIMSNFQLEKLEKEW